MTAQAAALVLLAEDDQDLRDIIASFLEAKGWRVIALAATPEICGDVVLGQLAVAVIDVRSSAATGFKLLEELRVRIAQLPIIVIASFGDDFVSRRARGMGALYVIEKPFDLEELDLALAPVANRYDPSVVS